MIILDTNVVSELMRPAPAEDVLAWVGRHAVDVLTTTSVSLAEVRYGILRLPAGRRKDSLLAAADSTFGLFAERVLPFDPEAARQYALIVVERQRAGAPISGFDAQIAGISRVRGAALATRNVEDFAGLDLTLLNPWQAGS